MFRTPVSLGPLPSPIAPTSRCLSVGSCFADFIGSRLDSNKLKSITNPHGIIFHPIAQFRVLEMAIGGFMPPEETYVKNQGIWYNYLFHSSVSASSMKEVENTIAGHLDLLKRELQRSDFLLLTFGTAVQYQLTSSGQLVANCHKVPQSEFQKSITPAEEINLAFDSFYKNWGSDAQVILSVSPIRHIKEGIEKNSVSKATLRVACEQIVQKYANVHYFPGFEIMIDDLRDYRFYEKDMVHPNETARDYIWNLFCANYLNHDCRTLIDQWQRISRNLEHRPFHPESPEHQAFIKKTIHMIEQLPDHIDTSKEVATLKMQLL